MPATVKSTQVFDEIKNKTLNLILQDLSIISTPGSITLPDGTIIKYGPTGSFASIPANSSAVETLVFAVPFPTSCDYFNANLIPTTSTDFYGMTSIVTQSKTQVQFTVRNGATAQALSGGFFMAIGK